MAEENQRRARGAAAKGVFETSKAAALEAIESEKHAVRSKSERLRALRETREQGEAEE